MIKKYSAILFLLVSTKILAQIPDISAVRNAHEIYSQNTINSSARYNAMAGAMGSLGGDISAMDSNPANLGISIMNNFSATLGFNNINHSSHLASNTFNHSITKRNLGQIGGIISINNTDTNSKIKFINIGINFSSLNAENYIETPENHNITYLDANNNPDIKFNGHAYNRTGNVSKVNLGLGVNMDNKIYFGGGVNIHSADLEQYDTANLINTKTQTNQFFNKQYTPYNENSSGFSMNAGVIGKVGQNVRLGFSLQSPIWWKIERLYTAYDNSSESRYTEIRSFSSPMKGTLSGSFIANKNFSLNIDYTAGLSRPKYDTESQEVDTEFQNFYKNNHKMFSEIKIGGEYRWNALRLRAGYAYQNNAFNPIKINSLNQNGSLENVTLQNFVSGKRSIIGFGIGYDFKALYIDASYQRRTQQYENPFLFGDNAVNSGYYSVSSSDSFTGDYTHSKVTEKNNMFHLTIGWRF